MTGTATTDRPLRPTFEPRHETYGPGAGFTVGLLGVGCIAVSLFGMPWLHVGTPWLRAGHDTFLELSGRARHVGVHDLGVPVYSYLSWAGFVLLAVTAGFVMFAGVPVPRSAAGNTYPRVIGALLAAFAAALQTYVITHAFPARLVAPGAWVGVAGYLVAIVGFVLGARRRVR
jgi:hypothetical protein